MAIDIFWALLAIPYGCVLKMCTGPMPPAPSHLSLIHRLGFYLCHPVYKQTLLGVFVFVMLESVLIAIEFGSPCIYWPHPSLRPLLDLLTCIAAIAVVCLFATVYGRRGSPEAEARQAEEINDLYLTFVQYYWH
ncbi:hypothetical protein FVEG_16755 [Fusarium verticillioides 7600]|uniref:Uncharacterized protein n=1 Tax=Gibberella moniliformis (strain M3125 / FGSC 7600) TaxID=334819 RepID=W7MTR8_GIBM7|nr:hypothetical protein FVEG_16755 [Fusarium verticillioides 7600]EWG51124.1 hypothetical protein FVEG_16755 [Fusarium verticillioides 7600]